MPDRRGFEYKGRFYELITIDEAWTSDAPLVERLTSLTWREFVDRASEAEGETELEVVDVTIMHAMIGMAVAHANPFWTREKTVRFMQRVKMDDVDFVGFEEEEEVAVVAAADGSPPELETSPSSSSGADSRSESDGLSNGSSPEPSGTALSDTSVEAH